MNISLITIDVQILFYKQKDSVKILFNPHPPPPLFMHYSECTQFYHFKFPSSFVFTARIQRPK